MLDPLYNFLTSIHDMMAGATIALFLVAALLFLRFYKKTRDRLFLFFAAAFVVLGTNRLIFLFAPPDSEPRSILRYAIRLLAFSLILYAIIDKNRKPKSP